MVVVVDFYYLDAFGKCALAALACDCCDGVVARFEKFSGRCTSYISTSLELIVSIFGPS